MKRKRLEAVSTCKACLEHQKEETNFLVRENKRFRYSLLEKENELLDEKLKCVAIKQEVQRLDEENNLSAMPKEELKAELEKVIKENLELEKGVDENVKLKEKLAFAEKERLMLNSDIVLLKTKNKSLDRQLISEQLENAVLSSKLSSSERNVQKLLGINNQLRSKIAEIEAKIIKFGDNREEVICDHQLENAVLSSKLSSPECNLQKLLDIISQLTSKVAKIEAEKNKLNKNIEEVISDQLENAVLCSKLSSSECSVQKLLKVNTQLREKVVELEEENNKLKENRDEVISDHLENAVLSSKLSDSIEQLRIKVAEMEAEKKNLEENREEENRRLQIQVLKSIKDKVQMNLALPPLQDNVSSREYLPAKTKDLPAKNNKSKRELKDNNPAVLATTEGGKTVILNITGQNDEELREGFCELLGERKEIQENTGWGEVEAVLQEDPRCQAVKNRNKRMLWFLDYVQDMKMKKEGKLLQGSQGKDIVELDHQCKDQHPSTVTGKTTAQPTKKICSSKRFSY